jgi:uncharacterized damage-inducible protein DinB
VDRAAAALLARQYARSRERLADRLAGLTDDEFRWAPVPDAWSVRPKGRQVTPHADGAADYVIDYDLAEPLPAPFTTIAWRLVHLAVVTNSYTDYAFGPATHDFAEDVIPGDAAGAVAWWRATAETFAAHLDRATDADLEQPRVYPFNPGADTVGSACRIVVDETTHHGAEIGCLRDLLRVLP